MATKPIIPSVTSVELRAAPIEPGWIRVGNPLARNATLSRSADGLASTLVWDCTAGEFEWIYDIDETIYFLEGSATISDGHNPAKTYGPGDVLFLPHGSVCHWHVETYVKKVAFCRRTLPRPAAFVIRAFDRLVRMMKGSSGGFQVGPAKAA
ncbi:cupin [Methylobacterium sp. Leaf469]|uniref:cupin domain-containing protein n=1 Tax=unclassified Methylobacterium TaxID=2615210 RepID=UPI0006F287E9|nr:MULTISPECIES: cupin domain-containing protein [unclassified Methylobacterium]KQO65900.1 cupin [Methylobacterium sp. Leaf87]KQP18916.1 cupin [Methylobacterium sp. Leaf100]KQP34649.1 cupin [Methylobacterium sp. Leaf102]KQP71999.1 cupin [Methylobacterium sp. Leaf112]KQU05721.1 cupin [Methylobacterium sp. Leaf469]